MATAIRLHKLMTPEEVVDRKKHDRYHWGSNDCSHFMYALCKHVIGEPVNAVQYHISTEQPRAYYEALKPAYQVSLGYFPHLKDLKDSWKVNGPPEHAMFAFHHGGGRHIFLLTTDVKGNRILVQNSSKAHGINKQVLSDPKAFFEKRFAKMGASGISMLDISDVMHSKHPELNRLAAKTPHYRGTAVAFKQTDCIHGSQPAQKKARVAMQPLTHSAAAQTSSPVPTDGTFMDPSNIPAGPIQPGTLIGMPVPQFSLH